MQKYKSNITSTTGAAIRNVPVTVLNEAGELASLFLDRAGAIAAPNPLVTDSSGNFYFYAVNGRYSLRTTVEGVTITDDDVVLLQDPVEITVAGPIAEAVASAQAAARQAQEVVDSSGIPDMVAAAQNAVIDSNQALQEARGASLASAEAKQAAESAKSAAELAKGDAQAASSTANTAAQQANAAAQNAAQSAASIDPARLLTPAERQKLDGVEPGATKNFAVTPIAAGTNLNSLTEPGFYVCVSSAVATTLVNSPFTAAFGLLVEDIGGASNGFLRRRQTATQDGGADSTRLVRNCRENAFTVWVPVASSQLSNVWAGQQTFTGGALASRFGINTPWNSGVGIYCTDVSFTANGNISGVNFDISTNSDTLTATRTHRAAYLRIRGNNTAAQLAGFTNALTGAEGVAELSAAVDGAGEATYLYGIRGYATDNSARTQALSGAYAGWFNSQHTGASTKTTTESIGVLAQITNNNENSTLTRATGVHTAMVNTAGTIAAGYIYRGTYTGAGTYGVKWGIHLAGSTQNQIDGWLALTDTTEATSTTTGALRVAGGLGVAKVLYAGAISTPVVYTQSVNNGQLAGRRNKIINGNFAIAQRAMPAVNPGNTLDRWFYGGSHDGGISVSQLDVASTMLSNGFTHALRATVTAPDTSIGANQSAFICQRIEGFNIRNLVGKPITLSLWVRTSLAGTYCIALRNGGYDRTYVVPVSLTANAWGKVVITLPTGLPASGGTWNYMNGIGLELSIALSCGATLQTATVNAWTTGSAIVTSAQVNFLGTSGATFDMTGVQLELGSTATDFEQPEYSSELAVCKRYYQTYPGTFNLTNDVNGANINTHLFMVEMRTTPTVVQSTSGTGASWVAVSTRAFGQGGIHSAISTTTSLEFNAEL